MKKLKEPLAKLLFKQNDLNLDKIVIMLFNSDRFINLEEPLLKSIIKRDDLILEEIDVWNSLLKLGMGTVRSVPFRFPVGSTSVPIKKNMSYMCQIKDTSRTYIDYELKKF
ncbi:hypothetical protein RirG_204820 [Rhizophagus irregularis DAOM 197198w]|uniref:Uncharacterized protein n=1 Tax=Rhizophagus irregularis (strain DAOM 197198w) TaxID=1432141 RepID=A0A015ITU4_RHIIW|nr:hypothetical protein RirG_204820 [Rhizophagus irregularis DAOM 197198w]